MTALARPAPAKLNLGLHVLRRRADGFHDLETVFLPIGWADTLAAAPASDLALTTTDPALPTDGRNLVVRAARALAAWGGVEAGARLHLDKRVPYGAGLGGGSSDAAAALRLLAELWELAVPDDVLVDLALGLGSDVPFFLDGRPALATGQGERLAPLLGAAGAPYRCPFWIVVAVPDVHVGTAEAYGLVTPRDRDRPALADVVRSNDLARWRAELANDFQAPVEAAHPAIAAARRALVAGGAGYASLSGSGSAVFGAFESEAAARAAARSATGCRVWVEARG
ncbi:4-(cytidine 5'-diphospho)-2-C-methyl-D-erythritol kinase, partial [Rubrivirga litoralis]